MEWKRVIPETQPAYRVDRRDFSFSIKDDYSGGYWQHFMLSFCCGTERSLGECQREWIREAISIARQKLDELESQLDSDGQTE